ncbi:MAG: MBL fold metallo-hydrolase [Phycisphaerales bacterium]|nr:MBL fold metallo-hydrolase [Phycisphaerales bacterium]
MARGESSSRNGVVAHGKGRRAIGPSDHEPHRHPLRARHLNSDWIQFFDASLQHSWQRSGYVLAVANLRIKGFPLGAWQTNCWLVWIEDGASRPGWIIDTGDKPAQLIEAVRAHGVTVEAILFTHAHLDHIMGLEAVVAALGDVPRYAHPCEQAWFGDPQLNLSAFAEVAPVSVRAPTRTFVEGDTLNLGGVAWRVLHTPGHSPGSVSLVCDGAKVVIAGDTLFAGSIGRSDFPTSDPEALLDSIQRKLLALPDAFVVHPGHGPSTTIGAERRTNPFLR